MNDIRNRVWRNVIHTGHFGYLVSLAMEVANLSHIVIGQFGLVIRHAGHSLRSTLRVSIGIIISFCAQKQMVGIDAGTNIACVAHTHSFWNRLFVQLIGKYVGKHFFGRAVDIDKTVAESVDTSTPEPARVSFTSVMSKAIFRRSGEVSFKSNLGVSVIPLPFVMSGTQSA